MSPSNLGRAFLVVAVCSAIAACGGQSIDARQLDFNNGLVYKHGSTTPFTGTVLFKDSIPEELVEYWANNVDVYRVGTAQNALTGCTAHYTNGVIDGSTECEGTGGKTVLTVSFSNEKYDGVSKIYNPQTGSLYKVIPWQAGVLNGEEKIYWLDTGKPNWDGNLSGGALDGSVKAWDHDGTLITDAMYSNGSLESGLVTKLGQDGSLISRGSYSNGKRDGKWEDWGGEVYGQIYNLVDKTVGKAFGNNSADAIFASDNYRMQTDWTNGTLHGLVTDYDKNGNVVFAVGIENAALNGPATFYPSASNKPIAMNFESGQLTGCMADKANAGRNSLYTASGSQLVTAIERWEAACEGGTAVAVSSPSDSEGAVAEKSPSGQAPQLPASASPAGQSRVVQPGPAAPVPSTPDTQDAAPAAGTLVRTSGDIRASFDCAKAESAVEKMICSNQMLADYDVRLMSNYKAAMAASSDKAAIKDAQRAWMAQRNACTTLDCVSRAYQLRIKQLDAAH